MPRSALLLLAVLSVTLVRGGVVDSLIARLPQLQGQERVMALGDISYELSITDPERAVAFAREGVRVAQGVGDSALVARAANDQAIAEQRAGNFQNAIEANLRALRIRTAAQDLAGMASSNSKLGTLYQETGRFSEAFTAHAAALRYYDEQGQVVPAAQVRGNLARLYQLQHDTAMALKVAQESLDKLRGRDDGYALAMALGQLSQIQLGRKDYVQAQQLSEEAYAVFERLGDRSQLASLSNNLGVILRDRGLPKEAAVHYRKALDMATEVGDRNGEALFAANLGNILLDLGRTAEAVECLQRALSISTAEHYARPRIRALEGLAKALELRGDLTGALSRRKQLEALKDSVYDAERSKAMSELQVRFETERTEKELAQERQRTQAQQAEIGRRRLINAMLIGGIGMLSIVTVLFVSRQRARHRAALNAGIIAERERGLRAVIDGTETERRRLAGELHDGVGQQLGGLRFRMEHLAGRVQERAPEESAQMGELLTIIDDAGKDVRGIAHRLRPRALDDVGLAPALGEMLQRALKRPDVQVDYEHFGMEERLPAEVETGVYRIAQELVANVIKHAHARKISVQLLRNKGHLVLIVEDDGEGMDTALAAKGIGLLSIHDRVRVLHGTVEFDSAPGRGTVATVRVPLQPNARS